MYRRSTDRSRFSAFIRETTCVTICAWLSAAMFVVSQFQLMILLEPSIWSTTHWWSIMSMIGLASSLGLSELRQRRNLVEMKSLGEAAWTDPLTGAVNRRAAELEMKRRLALYRRKGTPVSILLMDVDHFKEINDRWGHHVGDEVLKQITKVVTSTLREMDMVARFGGEEFIAILTDSNIRHAAVASERVRQDVEAACIVGANDAIRVTVSIGITAAIDGDDPETMLKRADEALYVAKRAGRNRVFSCASGLPCLDVAEQIET